MTIFGHFTPKLEGFLASTLQNLCFKGLVCCKIHDSVLVEAFDDSFIQALPVLVIHDVIIAFRLEDQLSNKTLGKDRFFEVPESVGNVFLDLVLLLFDDVIEA